MKQTCILNQVEILGAPESPNENVFLIFVKMGNKLGVHVSENDIDYIKQINGRHSKAIAYLDTGEMHCPIVVKFVRRNKKDEVLNAFRRVGQMTTEYVVNREPIPIGIYERVISSVKELYRQTCLRAQSNNYQFCWVLDGNVFVQKEPGTKIFRIRSIEDINRPIGTGNQPLQQR